MDERTRIERRRSPEESINLFLEKVESALQYLPDHAQDWDDPRHPTDAQEVYAAEWPTVVYGEMDGLEQAYTEGLMDSDQIRRYTAIKKLFKQRMPLIERYELDLPRVPLD